jgi:antitoxin component HigA of HigAB toxin-antitoxin module
MATIAKGYTTKTEIENFLMININEVFDTQVDLYISEIENVIDNETGRNFIADSTASERLFDGDNESNLLIDDCIEITKIEVDGEEITDYFKYPSKTNYPINEIALEDGVFNKGRQNVAVTAKWGFSAEVPKDIRLACTVLVSNILGLFLNGDDKVKTLSMGSYSVTYKDLEVITDVKNIKEILRKYQRMI